MTAIHEVVKDDEDDEESKLLNKESVISSQMISASDMRSADRTAGKVNLNEIIPKLDLQQLD